MPVTVKGAAGSVMVAENELLVHPLRSLTITL